MKEHDKILVLDFGSQYSQLIVRRIRELNVYSELQPYNYPLKEIKRDKRIKGIILSGGPASIVDEDSPDADPDIINSGLPILGLCYGMQWIAKKLSGELGKGIKREYGLSRFQVISDRPIFDGIEKNSVVWMSHWDNVEKCPSDFITIGTTDWLENAAISHKEKPIYGFQFHPEVKHTQYGMKMIENFVLKICKARQTWTPEIFIDSVVRDLKIIPEDEHVILAVSGGVDSTVLTKLLAKALDNRVHPVFVDNGLLRRYDREDVERVFKNYIKVPLNIIDAKDKFLNGLKGVEDPEEKRRMIGHIFIDVFEDFAKKFENIKYLAQGTLYPDLIESRSYRGPSETIKTHHNVGGLPEELNLKLIEPFRELFKDEVRKVGKELGLPDEVLYRHPFPGPGLAVRILGEVTEERIEIVQKADEIMIDEIKKSSLYNMISQAFTVLLPVKSVGVMGDKRTYENIIALRAVTTDDFMTADWFHFPYDVLSRISARIVNEVKGVNRVVYDVTSKPPATIEWE